MMSWLLMACLRGSGSTIDEQFPTAGAASLIAEPAALLQERFRQKHMDPLVAVDELRHTQVAGERAQHVSLVTSEIGARADVFDHFSDGLLGRVIEILVKAN